MGGCKQFYAHYFAEGVREFSRRHPNNANALDTWFRMIETNHFASFVDLRSTFPGVDRVKQLYVFNIGGNNYRLIAAIHFNRQKVFIRRILTHAEYDRGDWKE